MTEEERKKRGGGNECNVFAGQYNTDPCCSEGICGREEEIRLAGQGDQRAP